MTLQFSDVVRHDGEAYSITAVDGGGLFDPDAACWRGYICTYEITGGQLLLRELEIGRADPSGEPLLFGVAPMRSRRQAGPAVHDDALFYTGLATPIEFTGRLLVGREVVDLGYLNMGFWPAWLFEVVRELVFDRGRLLAAHDRSGPMAAIRDRLGRAGLGRQDGQTIEEWVSATFSLSYDYSWPSTGGRYV